MDREKPEARERDWRLGLFPWGDRQQAGTLSESFISEYRKKDPRKEMGETERGEIKERGEDKEWRDRERAKMRNRTERRREEKKEEKEEREGDGWRKGIREERLHFTRHEIISPNICPNNPAVGIIILLTRETMVCLQLLCLAETI